MKKNTNIKTEGAKYFATSLDEALKTKDGQKIKEILEAEYSFSFYESPYGNGTLGDAQKEIEKRKFFLGNKLSGLDLLLISKKFDVFAQCINFVDWAKTDNGGFVNFKNMITFSSFYTFEDLSHLKKIKITFDKNLHSKSFPALFNQINCTALDNKKKDFWLNFIFERNKSPELYSSPLLSLLLNSSRSTTPFKENSSLLNFSNKLFSLRNSELNKALCETFGNSPNATKVFDKALSDIKNRQAMRKAVYLSDFNWSKIDSQVFHIFKTMYPPKFPILNKSFFGKLMEIDFQEAVILKEYNPHLFVDAFEKMTCNASNSNFVKKYCVDNNLINHDLVSFYIKQKSHKDLVVMYKINPISVKEICKKSKSEFAKSAYEAFDIKEHVSDSSTPKQKSKIKTL